MSPTFALLGLLAVSVPLCNGKIYEDPNEIPSLDSYDYVIVGGGLTGSVVASRLTENSNTSVLLLEAGGSHQGVYYIEVPGLQNFTGPGTSYNWNYTSVPQVNLLNNTIPAPRGHVLGGSSSINGMWYTRGSSADYDRWANVTGDQGWLWDELQTYFEKSETFTSPVDGHNTSGQYDPALHGTQGPLQVTVGGYSQSLDQLVMGRLDEQFPFIEDYDDGEPIGFGWTQTTIGNGSRSSAATAYLDNYLNRTNLDIAVNSLVTRISASNGSSIDTVTLTANGIPINVTARVEVLLAAGVFNTPHILLNSGIGDATELSAMNIPVVHNLPSVGKNLTEQPAVSNLWNTSSPVPAAEAEAAYEQALAQWNSTRTGRMVLAISNTVGFARMNMSNLEVEALVEQYGELAPGPASPHFELLPTVNAFDAEANFANAEFILDAVNLVPYSRGSVTLDPTNPMGNPLIDYNFYSAPQDILVMRQAILGALSFVSTPDWQEFLADPVSPLFAAVVGEYPNVSNTTMDAYIRASTTISFHAVGSCSMSPAGADWGVVDPDFHVKGVKGLRIIDTSIMPFAPAGHSQAAAYVIAERAADIIKAST
ncbi:alcohol oxidase [Lentinula detonsa]|uniref:Alcohol oxidase n=1 Tax=Lentinula detonsa TaxID=2804962 RepID=A0A9W8NS83_9AGAR|nr:alcohol oxidase [Lentinula detonsa]